MSIENQIERLAIAIEKLAAVAASASPKAAPEVAPASEKPVKPSKPAKPAPVPAAEAEDDGLGDEDESGLGEPSYTLDDVKTKLFAVRDKVSKQDAGKILTSTGAPSLDKIPEDKFAAVIAACDAKLKNVK